MIITNIKRIGDPQIILFEGKYYCYATSHDKGFLVWESEDLVNWGEPVLCFEAKDDHWAYKDYWAPEVIYHNGKFVMHYSGRQRSNDSLRLGVAVSDSPLGPFVDVKNAPLFDYGYAAIDGSILVYQGKCYLYYSRDCSENLVDGVHTSQLYCVELDDTLTKVIGEPKLVTTPEYEFERLCLASNWIWNEGPFVIEYNGKLVMNYSANHYASNDYSICIATSNDPMGPWVKEEKANPVLRARDGMFGAGHNAFFYNKEGELMTSFHIQTDPEHPSGDRTVCIGRVTFKEVDDVLYQYID